MLLNYIVCFFFRACQAVTHGVEISISLERNYLDIFFSASKPEDLFVNRIVTSQETRINHRFNYNYVEKIYIFLF